MSRSLTSTDIGSVWLAWDGLGGHDFVLCPTKEDADRIADFWNDGSIQVKRFPLQTTEINDSEPPDKES
jgi:hypothetical protein